MCSADNVDVTPSKLAERGAVALPGQLAGDPAGRLGDPPKASDWVIPTADVGVAQVEHIELMFPACLDGFGPATDQQLSVAFRIKNDHNIEIGRASWRERRRTGESGSS